MQQARAVQLRGAPGGRAPERVGVPVGGQDVAAGVPQAQQVVVVAQREGRVPVQQSLHDLHGVRAAVHHVAVHDQPFGTLVVGVAQHGVQRVGVPVNVG